MVRERLIFFFFSLYQNISRKKSKCEAKIPKFEILAWPLSEGPGVMLSPSTSWGCCKDLMLK